MHFVPDTSPETWSIYCPSIVHIIVCVTCFLCFCFAYAFFSFFFNSIVIRLKLHTYDNVLQGLHALEIKNPNVLLNIPEENKKGKKKIPKT